LIAAELTTVRRDATIIGRASELFLLSALTFFSLLDLWYKGSSDSLDEEAKADVSLISSLSLPLLFPNFPFTLLLSAVDETPSSTAIDEWS